MTDAYTYSFKLVLERGLIDKQSDTLIIRRLGAAMTDLEFDMYRQ